MKSKMERFKCLICGNQFSTSQEKWNKFQEDQKSNKHPDEMENISCPKCKASQVQHLNPLTEKKISTNIKGFFEKITSFFGESLAEITTPFIVLWKEYQVDLIKNIFCFASFIIAILIVQKFVHLDYIYSSLLMVIYLVLNTFKR